MTNADSRPGPSARRSRSRRRLFAGLAVLLLIALGGGGALLARGDRDGLGEVRDVASVQSTALQGDAAKIVLRSDANAAGARASLDALPDDVDSGSLWLGKTVLQFDDGRAGRDLAAALIAVANVRTPAHGIEIADDGRVVARVDRPEHAAPLALEILGRLKTAMPDRAVREVSVEADRAGVRDALVSVRSFSGADERVWTVALEAARTVAGRQPEVMARGHHVEMRVRARSITDTAAAWRETTRALEADASVRAGVQLFVDRDEGEGTDAGRPWLSGSADERSDRAIALLRRLEPLGPRAFARTDLAYAEAEVSGASAARTAADAARAAAVGHMTVSWRMPEADTVQKGRVAGEAREGSEISDSPATILKLLPGIQRARSAGIDSVRWDRAPTDDRARLRMSRPSWLVKTADLTEKPAALRRLARAIRSIGWQGDAYFDVILGAAGCPDTPKAAAVARVTSTSRGRAQSVEAAAACTDGEALATARRAWNSTATP